MPRVGKKFFKCGKARLVDFFLRVGYVDFGKKIVGSSPTMTGGGRAFLVLRPIIVGGRSFGLAISLRGVVGGGSFLGLRAILFARVLGLTNALGRGRPHQCRSVGGDDCGAVPGNGDGGAGSERAAWKKFAQGGDPSGRPVLGLKRFLVGRPACRSHVILGRAVKVLRRLPGQVRQYAATRRFVKEIIHMSALADCQ